MFFLEIEYGSNQGVADFLYFMQANWCVNYVNQKFLHMRTTLTVIIFGVIVSASILCCTF